MKSFCMSMTIGLHGHGEGSFGELSWGTSEMPAACHYMRRFGILAMTCCILKWCEHG